MISLEGDGQRCFMESESGLTLFQRFRLWIIWTPAVMVINIEKVDMDKLKLID